MGWTRRLPSSSPFLNMESLVTTFGLKGETGAQGPQGIQGPQGPSGISPPTQVGIFYESTPVISITPNSANYGQGSKVYQIPNVVAPTTVIIYAFGSGGASLIPVRYVSNLNHNFYSWNYGDSTASIKYYSETQFSIHVGTKYGTNPSVTINGDVWFFFFK